ncbi:MAG: 5'-nucleotidase C-terminal domain-containing protein [Capsulimonadaceae bacterium]
MDGRTLLTALAIALLSSPAPATSGDSGRTLTLTSAVACQGSAAHETVGGDIVADAVREATHADVALIPADEINEDAVINAGKVKVDALSALVRFGRDSTDLVIVVPLKGEQILKAAARSVTRVPRPFDGFLQVSGVLIRAGSNHKVAVSAVDGAAIDPAATYSVAMTESLANGGFGYFLFWDVATPPGGPGITVTDCLDTYAAAHSILNPALEGRIITQ